MHSLTPSRIVSMRARSRRVVTSALFALSLGAGLAMPFPVFSQAICTTTVTRYYFLGIEVWRVESTRCIHGNN